MGITEVYSADHKQSSSKFHAFLYPVKDRDEVNRILKSLWEKFPDATHICHATLLGLDNDFQHFSDDGEPSNSAGRPILHALLGSNLKHVFGAVVRYYGGKKLGVPGLIEAYGGSIKMCLEQVEPVKCVLKDILNCSISYEHSYKLFNLLNQNKSLLYSNSADQFTIEVPKSLTSGLLNELQKIPTLAILE